MKKLMISMALGFVSFASLTYFLLVRRSSDMDSTLIFRYFIVGAILALYSYLLLRKNFKVAFYTLAAGIIISSVYIGFALENVRNTFADLGAILMWMIIMGVSIVAGIILEWIVRLRKS